MIYILFFIQICFVIACLRMLRKARLEDEQRKREGRPKVRINAYGWPYVDAKEMFDSPQGKRQMAAIAKMRERHER